MYCFIVLLQSLTEVEGYSWKSNRYGLTVDTVTAYELVKPNGDIVTVTHDSDSDLFFALKVRCYFFISSPRIPLICVLSLGWFQQFRESSVIMNDSSPNSP